MSDIMVSMGLDVQGIREGLEKAESSFGKLKQGAKGNFLAMAGGIAIAGAAIYTFANASKEEFDALIDSSRKLSDEFKKIGASGTFDEAVGAIGRAKEKVDELNKGIKGTETLGGKIAGGFNMIFNAGEDQATQQQKAADEINRKKWEQLALENRIAKISEDELALSELKVGASKEEIENYERKKKLIAEIAKIDSLDIDGSLKKQLRDNASLAALNNKTAKEAEKARDKSKKDGEEIQSASEKMVAAEQELVDLEIEKLGLKDQAAIQSGKVADAEENLAKAAKGTVEWYERKAALAKEQLRLETLIGERAKAYAKSTSAGRKFDREQVKQKRNDDRARARLDKQIARENGRPAPAVRGGAGMVAPRPMMQPNAPAAPAAGGQGGAVAMMQVASLVVGELKSK